MDPSPDPTRFSDDAKLSVAGTSVEIGNTGVGYPDEQDLGETIRGVYVYVEDHVIVLYSGSPSEAAILARHGDEAQRVLDSLR